MIERIRLDQKKLESDEAVIVMGEANRLYFTGFHSSAGVLLITKRSARVLIDFRYYENAVKRVKHCDVVLADRLYAQLDECLSAENVKTVYTETSYINLGQFTALQKNLSDFIFSII